MFKQMFIIKVKMATREVKRNPYKSDLFKNCSKTSLKI